MSAARILVADDDETTCVLMQAALIKAGHVVELAHDGGQALVAFEQAPFDMVMLDVDMPRMNGFATCAALRRRWGAELPIVMVTGMDDIASIEAAFEAGATDFIAKLAQGRCDDLLSTLCIARPAGLPLLVAERNDEADE